MSPTRLPIVAIVEDDRELADVYAEWLTDSYSIRMAHSAGEAQEIIDDDVDVVLLDRRLPSSSGDDVLDWIQEQGIDTRVAVITAVSPDFDIIEMGFDAYAVKPVSMEELRDTVQMLLTRTIYDQRIQKYLELLSKTRLLEAEMSEEELNQNPEYAALSRQKAQLRAEIDYLIGNLDDEYFAAELQAMVDSETPLPD